MLTLMWSDTKQHLLIIMAAFNECFELWKLVCAVSAINVTFWDAPKARGEPLPASDNSLLKFRELNGTAQKRIVAFLM
jgi:hypothetical protein